MFHQRVVVRIFIFVLLVSFLFYSAQPAAAFWPFKKKPNSVPSDELTLILEAGSKSLVDELGGSGRVSNYCEAVIMELALGGMLELVSKNPIDNAKKTFINIQKTILAGMGKEGADIIIAMTKKAFEEQMEDRQQKSKEKDEKVVLSRKNTNTGCDYTMTVDWLKKEIKKEKRVHVLMEGDCHCKPQLESRVSLSKFKTEFDIEYYYEVMEYEVEGQTQKAYGVFGGLKKREEPYKFPLDKISQSWYQGRDDKEAECGCKDGKPVKEVSAGPGIINPDSRFAFLDTVTEKIGMLFAFGPQRKTEKALGYAKEKLAEMVAMADVGDSYATGEAADRYEDFVEVALRESEKIKGGQKDKTVVLMNEELSVDKETLEKIIARSVYTPEESQEQMRAVIQHFVDVLRILIQILSEIGRALSPFNSPDGATDAEGSQTVNGEIKGEVKKEEVKKDAPKTELKPEPKDATAQKPVEEPVEKSDEKSADDAPQDQEVGYFPDYYFEEALCGDGIVTAPEICDGNAFSQMCLDSVQEYKTAMGNPNLVPRCFNSCRGCEAAMPQ